jgi:hypothetical protein
MRPDVPRPRSIVGDCGLHPGQGQLPASHGLKCRSWCYSAVRRCVNFQYQSSSTHLLKSDIVRLEKTKKNVTGTLWLGVDRCPWRKTYLKRSTCSISELFAAVLSTYCLDFFITGALGVRLSSKECDSSFRRFYSSTGMSFSQLKDCRGNTYLLRNRKYGNDWYA